MPVTIRKPGRYDFTIEKGCSFERIFQMIDSEDAAIDITGYVFFAEARDKRNNKKIDLAPTILDETTGEVLVTFDKDATKSNSVFPAGWYEWDLLAQDADGFRAPIVHGVLTVKWPSTRPSN